MSPCPHSSSLPLGIADKQNSGIAEGENYTSCGVMQKKEQSLVVFLAFEAGLLACWLAGLPAYPHTRKTTNAY